MASRPKELSNETCTENASRQYSVNKGDIVPKSKPSDNAVLNESENQVSGGSSRVCDDVGVDIVSQETCSKEAVENMLASEDDKTISASGIHKGDQAYGDVMSGDVRANSSTVVDANCGEKTENTSSEKSSSQNLDSSGKLSAANTETLSSQSYSNLKVKTDKVSGDLLDETPKCSHGAEQVEKLVESSDVQDPLSSASGDENEESDNVEQDVSSISAFLKFIFCSCYTCIYFVR